VTTGDMVSCRRHAVDQFHHLRADPATHDDCTLGGMIGNNSCRIHAVVAEFYGPGLTTAHQVESLDVFI
jgi:hypothetical protein